MKILVTGGSGFIGSALIRFIVSEKLDTVVNIDKLTYAINSKALASVEQSSRYHFEKVDICDRNRLEDIFKKFRPELVIHLAAESHVDNSIQAPNSFIQTNIIGTYNLIEVCKNYYTNSDSRLKQIFRFHHVSTDEVYGDLGDSPLEFTEKSRYKPSSPYSASKASSDHLVRAWHRTYGLPTVITNCSNNYGPYQNKEKLIPRVIHNALNGETIPVYGRGDQIRDWLYVEDHARALYTVLKTGITGETYNIGGNQELKNLEVIHTICNLLEEIVPNSQFSKSRENIDGFLGLVKHVTDRPGHDQRYAVNISKIKEELGWEPIESFNSGIAKTITWYLEN